MIRTKHFFVAAAFALLVTVGGGSAALMQKNVPAFTQPAAVTLGVPDEAYPVAPSGTEDTDRDAFVDRIRASYVPPPVTEEPPATEPVEPGPIIIEPAPEPIPEPAPTPLPVAVTTESTSTAAEDTGTSTSSDVATTSSLYGNADI